MEALKLIECLVREILRWRLILLHALKITDNLLGTGLLLINYTLEIVELLVNFLGYFILKLLLVADPLLHLLALLEVIRALFLDIFEVLQVHIGCLLESERLTPVVCILEVALVTEGCVVRAAVDLQLVGVLAKLDLVVHFI